VKLNKSILFLIFNTLILIACFLFSNHKYHQKNNLELNVIYSNPARFLNDSIVNKLLTQNFYSKYGLQKDSLDLNILENQMNKIPEVENVEIFVLPEGVLTFHINERKPLFKVNSSPSLYSDVNGVLFNFKSIDSSKYTSFKTISSTISLETSAYVIKNLKKDPFLSEQLYKVELIKDQYQLKLKSFDFEIIFGSPKRMKEKIKKLKVFCTFQRAQDSLTNYQKINLSYTNQVVATTY
jgi:Mg2+ and Co2+ transporter CorA